MSGYRRRSYGGAALGLAAAALAAGCAPADSPAGPLRAGGPPIDLAGYELLDLSYPYDEETIYWPTAPSHFELEQLSRGRTEGGWFYAANAFSTPEHGGTHLDAPIHFAAGRWSVDEIPLDHLLGPAVVLDVRAAAAEDADHRLTVAEVERWEVEHGEVPAGAVVLLYTGWGERWPDPQAYLGPSAPDDASDLHFPAYGAASARLLVEERRVAVLGLDTASIDCGPSKDFPVHRIAGEANVPGLENVAGLDRLPPTGAWVIALPMKIAGGSGGPVRIVALVPR